MCVYKNIFTCNICSFRITCINTSGLSKTRNKSSKVHMTPSEGQCIRGASALLSTKPSGRESAGHSIVLTAGGRIFNYIKVQRIREIFIEYS